jgi:hypothetical protein
VEGSSSSSTSTSAVCFGGSDISESIAVHCGDDDDEYGGGDGGSDGGVDGGYSGTAEEEEWSYANDVGDDDVHESDDENGFSIDESDDVNLLKRSAEKEVTWK